MQIWSSWQGYGCLTYACTGVTVVSTSCATILEQFPVVARTQVHCDHQQLRLFCSFLGLFAPVHAQDAQIRSTAHRVLPTKLLLLEQYHNIILMLQKQLLPSDSLNEGRLPPKAAYHLYYFDPLTTTQRSQVNFI